MLIPIKDTPLSLSNILMHVDHVDTLAHTICPGFLSYHRRFVHTESLEKTLETNEYPKDICFRFCTTHELSYMLALANSLNDASVYQKYDESKKECWICLRTEYTTAYKQDRFSKYFVVVTIDLYN
uniref:Uncharacterized protein n=1 Tax=Glossina austeni TaxID=7395 RepID=A0A1A9V901_GLOAU